MTPCQPMVGATVSASLMHSPGSEMGVVYANANLHCQLCLELGLTAEEVSIAAPVFPQTIHVISLD